MSLTNKNITGFYIEDKNYSKCPISRKVGGYVNTVYGECE